MPTLREAYARLRALQAELHQVQATIDRLTLDPDLFRYYREENAFSEREDHIVSVANLPLPEDHCPEPELTAVFNADRWRVEDNLNGCEHSGTADNFADAQRQVILAMADYVMKKETT